ncbi:MAG TPA: S8 family serine peptidase [Symbiobacteriaceae bacterium]|jgi:subtilisin family serine protease
MPYVPTGTAAVITPADVTPVSTDFGRWVRERRLAAFHQAGITGKGVRVAIIDTGCDVTHPYLASAIRQGENLTPGFPASDVHDHFGHGTHVSGIIRQGAPGCDLIILKGISDDGYGEDAWLAAAIRRCIDLGVHIINASWGDPAQPTDGVLKSAVDDAVAAGILFVAAAGNDGHQVLTLDTVIYPAKWQSPLAVASTFQMVPNLYPGMGDVIATYSAAGPEVDTCAPGTDVYSCAPGGGYVYMSGTSMAAPMQVALAACLYEAWFLQTGRYPTEPEAVSLCLWHTRDISAAGRDILAGVGEIDAAPLVQRRRVALTKDSATITIEHGNRAGMTTDTYQVDVPAHIEDPGRFVAEFRGLSNVLGAAQVEWDPTAQKGMATIDVLDMGPTDNK